MKCLGDDQTVAPLCSRRVSGESDGDFTLERARSLVQGSAIGEELLQQCAAFVLEDAAAYVDAMVEAGIAYDVKQ